MPQKIIFHCYNSTLDNIRENIFPALYNSIDEPFKSPTILKNGVTNAIYVVYLQELAPDPIKPSI